MPTSFNISVELLENDRAIGRKILEALADEFNNKVQNKIPNIRDKVADVTMNFIRATEVYDSLVTGGSDKKGLAAHFGLPSWGRQGMVDSIVNTIGANIEITFRPIKVRGNNFDGGMNIGILIKDFTDILSLPGASVVTAKSQMLPWLEWLLVRGNKIIIDEYEIHLISGKGRSNFAVMIKNNAAVWRVPSEYSGVMNDNWLIRAILDNVDNYKQVIQNIIERELT